ncbi:thermonuclease family protein [Thioalkalicoccus limnaeus]|uniref:Thermonuclease family protein n=1 Tax=Thioalkalicoccus limnaeus TaxID=120681 RepID=A0ABV4BFL1_9GAMM
MRTWICGALVCGLAVAGSSGCDVIDWGLGEPHSCRLSSIHDGDTVSVRCAGDTLRVRLYCIDAPEMSQSPWGAASRDHLRRLAPERVDLWILDRDRYGRKVGELLDPRSGQSLNLAMVRAGQAAVYRQFCDDWHFHIAEFQARREGLGIWSQPGLHPRPWAYRR